MKASDQTALGHGDACVWTNDNRLKEVALDLLKPIDKYTPPHSWHSIRLEPNRSDIVKTLHRHAESDEVNNVAFVGELQEEMREEGAMMTIDQLDDDDVEAPGEQKDDKEIEDTEYFEEIPVPHDGMSERERKRRW